MCPKIFAFLWIPPDVEIHTSMLAKNHSIAGNLANFTIKLNFWDQKVNHRAIGKLQTELFESSLFKDCLY